MNDAQLAAAMDAVYSEIDELLGVSRNKSESGASYWKRVSGALQRFTKETTSKFTWTALKAIQAALLIPVEALTDNPIPEGFPKIGAKTQAEMEAAANAKGRTTVAKEPAAPGEKKKGSVILMMEALWENPGVSDSGLVDYCKLEGVTATISTAATVRTDFIKYLNFISEKKSLKGDGVDKLQALLQSKKK
jgi:hypothetical protein